MSEVEEGPKKLRIVEIIGEIARAIEPSETFQVAAARIVYELGEQLDDMQSRVGSASNWIDQALSAVPLGSRGARELLQRALDELAGHGDPDDSEEGASA